MRGMAEHTTLVSLCQQPLVTLPDAALGWWRPRIGPRIWEGPSAAVADAAMSTTTQKRAGSREQKEVVVEGSCNGGLPLTRP